MGVASRPVRAIHAELLASVFATVLPSLIMSALFAGVGALVVGTVADLPARLFYAAGLVATAVRIGLMLRARGRIAGDGAGPAELRAIERRYAAAYLIFAGLLGAFACRGIAVAPEGIATIVAVLVVGYAAGVSSTAALRPRISVPAMLLAVVPVIAMAADRGDREGLVLAICLAGFLFGGVRSTLVRYRAAHENASMRHMLAAMARTDPLTALPNRLALGEYAQDAARRSIALGLIVIDLDGFKEVNDRFGHPAGDAVLVEIARRLTRAVDGHGIVARTGGDEFVLAAPLTLKARTLSTRIEFALAAPYLAAGEAIPMSASLGHAELEPDQSLMEAIARADRALYRMKRRRAAEPPVSTQTNLPLRMSYRARR